MAARWQRAEHQRGLSRRWQHRFVVVQRGPAAGGGAVTGGGRVRPAAGGSGSCLGRSSEKYNNDT
eukprot:505989-Prymnesium_polylepis.1